MLPRPIQLKSVWSLDLPFYHRSCECNEIVALSNRVMSPLEEVTGEGRRIISRLRRLMFKLGDQNRKVPLTTQSFLDQVTIPGKKRVYAEAGKEFEERGIDYTLLRLKAFVKAEPVHGESKDPRLIQAAPPIYNVALGRYNKPVEWSLGKLPWHKVFGGHCPRGRLVAKGLNNVQRAALIKKKFDRFTDPVMFGIDASRFDMHVSHDILDVEFALTYGMYRNDPEVKALCEWQKGPPGITSNGVKYKGGGRISGVPNTGSGNSIININLVLSYFSVICKFDFICDGDDGVVFLEREDAEAMVGFSPHCAHLGFRMTIEDPVYELCDVEFCQSKPVEVRLGKWVMVRNPKRAIYRGLMSNVSMNTPLEARQTMWAVGSCELALHSGVPVMQEYALFCLREGVKPSSRKLEQIKHRLSHQYWHLPKSHSPRPVSAHARAVFAAAFGVSVAEQLFIENMYRKAKLPALGVLRMLGPEDTGAGQVSSLDERVYTLR